MASNSQSILMCPDLEKVSETAENLLLTEVLAASHLWELDETIELITQVVRELCEERIREVRQFAKEFSLLSGTDGGWRRGGGDSCNNSTLVSMGNFLWHQLLALLPCNQDRLLQPVLIYHEYVTKLWFYSRTRPPDLSTQKCIDTDLALSPEGGSRSYLISCAWYNKWLGWVNPDKTSSRRILTKVRREPGPIDNSCLFERWQLRKSLLSNLTVTHLGEKGWSHLISWYGLAKGSMVVCEEQELYPLTIRTCIHGGASSHYRGVNIGSCEPLLVLVDKIKYMFGISERRKSRVYIYFNRSSFYRVEDLTELTSTRLFNGQIVQLQLQTELGEWEERDDVISSDQLISFPWV